MLHQVSIRIHRKCMEISTMFGIFLSLDCLFVIPIWHRLPAIKNPPFHDIHSTPVSKNNQRRNRLGVKGQLINHRFSYLLHLIAQALVQLLVSLESFSYYFSYFLFVGSPFSCLLGIHTKRELHLVHRQCTNHLQAEEQKLHQQTNPEFVRRK